jgi:hypothetical protein
MVTDQQVRRLFKVSNTERTQIAVAKAGMDVKTGRKYLGARRLPSEMKAERHWRTRKDQFDDVWREVEEQLNGKPGWRPRRFLPSCSGSIPSGSRRAVADAAAQGQALVGDRIG